MIQATDIRIGNTINCRMHNNDAVRPSFFYYPITINEIHSNCIISLGQRIEFEYLKPIPLTEEWILKFGFEKVGEGEFKKGNLILQFTYYEKGNMVNVFLNGTLVNFVLFIHQLQNIFYSLTNTELTIINKNLPKQ